MNGQIIFAKDSRVDCEWCRRRITPDDTARYINDGSERYRCHEACAWEWRRHKIEAAETARNDALRLDAEAESVSEAA